MWQLVKDPIQKSKRNGRLKHSSHLIRGTVSQMPALNDVAVSGTNAQHEWEVGLRHYIEMEKDF